MLARLLFLLVAALAIFSWLWRLLGGGRAAAGRGRPGQAPRPDGRKASTAADPMVRDRVCNTFLPRSRALRLQIGAEEHFFCSEGCRDRYQSGG